MWLPCSFFLILRSYHLIPQKQCLGTLSLEEVDVYVAV